MIRASMPPAPFPLERQLRRLRAYALLTYPFACVPFLYFYFRDHGVDLQQYGVMIACYYLAMVVLEVPTGLLADRVGARLPMIVGPFVLAAGFALFLLVPTFAGFCAGEVVLGAGHSLLSGPPAAVLYASLRRGRRTGEFLAEESRMQALRLLGTAAAFFAGGFVVAAAGFRAAILLTILLHLLGGLAGATLAPLRATRLRAPALLTSALRDLRDGAVLWILALYAILFVLLRYVFHTYQTFLEAARAEDPIPIGLLFCALNLVAAPCSTLVPRLHRRLGLGAMLWLVLLLLAGSMLPLSLLVTQAGALLFFLHQVPFGMHWALFQDFVNHRIARRSRTTVLSAMSFGGRLVFALLFPLLMSLQDRAGIAAAWLWIGIAGLAVGGAWLWLGRRYLVAAQASVG